MANILEVRNLSKSFEGNYVLKDINITIEDGEIYGIIGANGSGKSTFMNILNGNEKIRRTGGYEGNVLIDNQIVKINDHSDSKKHGIAMVHQELALFKGMTVTENIKINKENIKFKGFIIPELAIIDKEQDKKDSISTLNKIGLSIDPDCIIELLTTNQKQLVEIARELSDNNVKLLMLDEPTSSLNITETKILMKRLKEIAGFGISIIFVSHRLEEIVELCDIVAVLRDGKLISIYEKKEFDINKFSDDMVGREVVKTVRKGKKGSKEVLMEYKSNENLNLSIHSGEIVGITGLAGQGQEIFSEGIFGLQDVDFDVEFRGQMIDKGNINSLIKHGIYYLSEDRADKSLFINSPVWKNVIFGTTQKHPEFLKSKILRNLSFLDNEKILDYTNKIIEELNIVCRSPYQLLRELSGGNQQKVCIGRAITFEPDLLFIGEPTRGIDIYSKEIILNWLVKINKEMNTTVVVTSGELEELIRICDRIVVMYQGKIFKVFDETIDINEITYALYGREIDEK